MKSIACPNCSNTTAKSANKPYCSHCGWNVSAAEESVRIQSVAYLIVAGLFAVVFGYGALIRHGNGLMEIAAAVFLAGAFPIYYFARAAPLRQFRELRKSLSIPIPTLEPLLKIETRREVRWSGSAPIEESSTRTKGRFDLRVHVDRPQISISQDELNAPEPASAQKQVAEVQLRSIEAMPRPRQVRMIRRGLVYIFLVGPPLVLFDFWIGYVTWMEMTSAHSPGGYSGHDWVLLITTFLLTATLIRFVRKFLLDRRLLEAGEIALGRIVRQHTDRYGSSTITYAFSDRSLRNCSKTGTDYSKSYYEGMWALIFYNPSDLRKNVADGCALYRLHVP